MRQYQHILGDLIDDMYALEEKWIQKMHMKKGALRTALKVKGNKDIPQSKLVKAEHSKNPTLRRRAALAMTFKKMHHRGNTSLNELTFGEVLDKQLKVANRIARNKRGKASWDSIVKDQISSANRIAKKDRR
jgi:hypothetical protein